MAVADHGKRPPTNLDAAYYVSKMIFLEATMVCEGGEVGRLFLSPRPRRRKWPALFAQRQLQENPKKTISIFGKVSLRPNVPI